MVKYRNIKFNNEKINKSVMCLKYLLGRTYNTLN